jgi:hypothetical protein
MGIRRAWRQASLFPWGDVMPDWIPNGGRGPLQAPWPVTLGEPTDFGLFGIATNGHEWCADWHDQHYYSRSPERNPAGPDQGVRRASRGGAWRHAYTMCRVTLRSKLDPSFRYNDGIRSGPDPGVPPGAARPHLQRALTGSADQPSDTAHAAICTRSRRIVRGATQRASSRRIRRSC